MTIILSHASALAFWRSFEGDPAALPAADVRCAPRSVQVDEGVVAALSRRGVVSPIEVLADGKAKGSRTSLLRGRGCSHALDGLILQSDLPEVLVVSPELCVVQNAASHSLLWCVELLCEFFGSYRRGGEEVRYDAPILTNKKKLLRHLGMLKGMHGAKKVREAVSLAGENAASVQESRSFLKLSLPHCRGGLGVSSLLLNHEIALSEQDAAVLGKSSCRIDLYLPQHNVGIEYDSYQEHLGKRKHDDDALRRTVLSSLGIPIHVLTYAQASDPDLLAVFVRSLLFGTGEKMRVRCKDYRKKQDELWKQLDGRPPRRLLSGGAFGVSGDDADDGPEEQGTIDGELGVRGVARD